MIEAKVRPDTSVFSKLAESSKTIEGVLEILSLMSDAKVQPDANVFRKFADSAKNIEDARKLVTLMSKAKVKPDTSVFSGIARCAKTKEDVLEILALMSKAKVRPNATVFRGFADGAKTMEAIRHIRTLMAEAGITPDARHYKVFIGACTSAEEAEEFLAELEKVKEKPSFLDLNKLLSNTSDEVAAERVWALFTKYGLTHDEFSFNILIKKAASWETAWDTYRARRPQGVRISGYTLNPVLMKVQTKEQLRVTMDEMVRRKVAFDKFTVRAIVLAELSDQDALWGLQRVKESGFDPAIDLEISDERAGRLQQLLSRLKP